MSTIVRIGKATAYGFALLKGYKGSFDDYCQAVKDVAEMRQVVVENREYVLGTASAAKQSADRSKTSESSARQALADAQSARDEAKAYMEAVQAQAVGAGVPVVEIDGEAYTVTEKVERGRRVMYYTPVAKNTEG